MINDNEIKIIGHKSSIEFEDNMEALEYTAKLLLDWKLVKDSYLDAIKDRENSFPTGLEFQNYGIAIPHTDSEHVISEAMVINILDKPVKFEQMATEGLYTDIDIIVMLAIKNKENQVPYLQTLIEIFQDEQKVNALISKRDNDELEETFKQYLMEVK